MDGIYFNLSSPEGETILLERKIFVFWEKEKDCLTLYPKSFEVSDQIRELLYCLNATFATNPNNMDLRVYTSDDSWYRILGVLAFMQVDGEPVTLVRIS